jgi:hypothetical protein
LRVLEERRVDRPGRVVEGEEHDPATAADRWRLGRHLDPGDEDLAAAAGLEDLGRPGHPEGVEHRPVEVDDVGARVEAEDVELGADAFRAGHLGQSGALLEPGRVAEVEGQLDRLGGCGDDRLRGLGLSRGTGSDV